MKRKRENVETSSPMVKEVRTGSRSPEEKRWSTIGICLNKILTPILRKAIAVEFQDWYERLTKPPIEIDKQHHGKHRKTLPPARHWLQYQNINGNTERESLSEFDYAVKDPVSCANLFLHSISACFTGFDETMSLDAALSVMLNAKPFAECGAAPHAKDISRNVKSPWAEGNFRKWTNDKFTSAIEEMQSFVESLKLSDEDKKEVCDELQRMKDKESPESWKWVKSSRRHEKMFDKLIRHGRSHPDDILEINGVRVCLKKDFLIGEGGQSDGVYVALGTDGSEKAIKLFLKATRGHLAEEEKKLLTTCETKDPAAHVVKYWFLDDKSHKTFAFLIMELCEETLEKFVSDNNLADLIKHAPDIIQQILRGLVGLHRKPKRILHRDLKPLNILQNVHGNWLLADFGIGRILSEETSTLLSMQRGTKMWMAVESYEKTHDGKVPYKTKSDIQVTGMVAFHILTKGQHPFGEVEQVHTNLLAANPVNLKMLDDHLFAKDLISWMLSKDPKERPSAEEALQHPYLKSKVQQFKLLWGMGNYVKRKDANSDVLKELNKATSDWKTRIESDVLNYLCHDQLKKKSFPYSSFWADCLRLIRNINEHWKDYPRTEPEAKKVDDPQEFFLNLFPDLVLMVYKIARSSDDLKEALIEYFKKE